MSYTVIYTDYNGYPGSKDTYDFFSGAETPLLPDVNLYNTFNFEIESTSAASGTPSTQESGAGSYNKAQSWRTSGSRPGTSTKYPHNAYMGVHIARIPTAMRWVNNQGPTNDGIAQNEKGDWFSEEVLAKGDNKGGGVTFVTNAPQAGTYQFTFVTSAEDTRTGGTRTQTHTFSVPYWNSLSIKGSYNAAVFCYNEFGYTDDYEGGTYEVSSLWELPEKFDRLYKYIPDQREFTTLTFRVEVDWQLYVSWGIYGNDLSASQQQSILTKMGYNTASQTGTDTHSFTHVVNNSNNDHQKILNDLISDRQRSEEEINERYNQTFPETVENVEFTQPTKVQ